ncbi:MAG: winged helix-turn-helix domain-containing protein [Nitrososphaerales archaeon]
MVKLTAPQTFKVVNYLLAHPNTSQVEISTSVEVSRDLVNHVVQELEAPGIVLQESRGHLKLKDPLRLLEALSIERPLSKLVIGEVRTEESDVSKVERMIRNAAVHSIRGGYQYAFTCFSAISKYVEYYITYPSVHVYSNRPDEIQKSIVGGRGDVTVQILKPDFELILRNARLIRDLKLVEPVQVVLDLFCLGGAGRDGAVKLYESMTQVGGTRNKSEKASIAPSKRVVRRTA